MKGNHIHALNKSSMWSSQSAPTSSIASKTMSRVERQLEVLIENMISQKILNVGGGSVEGGMSFG